METIAQILRTNLRELPSASAPFAVKIGLKHSPYTTIKAWTYTVMAAPVIWLFLRFRLSANFASLLLIVTGPVALGVTLLNSPWTYMGLLMFIFVNFFDYVDGNVARRIKTVSSTGHALDSFGAVSNASSLIIALTVIASRTSESTIPLIVGLIWLWVFLLNQVLANLLNFADASTGSAAKSLVSRFGSAPRGKNWARILKTFAYDGRSRLADSLVVIAFLQLTLFQAPVLIWVLLIFAVLSSLILLLRLQPFFSPRGEQSLDS